MAGLLTIHDRMAGLVAELQCINMMQMQVERRLCSPSARVTLPHTPGILYRARRDKCSFDFLFLFLPSSVYAPFFQHLNATSRLTAFFSALLCSCKFPRWCLCEDVNDDKQERWHACTFLISFNRPVSNAYADTGPEIQLILTLNSRMRGEILYGLYGLWTLTLLVPDAGLSI